MDINPQTDRREAAPKHSAYIFPGSFDPVTLGHQDIIARAAVMCDRLIVAVGQNQEKKAMFSVGERVGMLSDVVESLRTKGAPGIDKIEIQTFDGLLVNFAAKAGAGIIVKGLRVASDFEYEYQMALLNKYLDEGLETIFLMTNAQYTHISSRAVKIIAMNGGRLDGLVPACVIDRIEKFVKLIGVGS